jgi:hypothetical protein
MFSWISTEDILRDQDPDVSYKTYSNVGISRVSCDLKISTVIYLNDHLEHLFMTFYISALPKKNLVLVDNFVRTCA